MLKTSIIVNVYLLATKAYLTNKSIATKQLDSSSGDVRLWIKRE